MTRLAVIGAGTMGHGIAQVAAMAGIETRLVDRDADVLVRALEAVRSQLNTGVEKGKVTPATRETALGALRTTVSLADAVKGADIVIEAVPENLDLKRGIFQQVEGLVDDATILASNTSSIPIKRIGEGLSAPARLLGMHFFNPVHIMPLLEVIRAPATRDDAVQTVLVLAQRLGKTAIVVNDAPGFATSRLGVALGMEAIRMVEQGVASPEDIDTAMVLGYRHPLGPLKLTDLVGLDVRLAIGEALAAELNNAAFEPPALMRQMVADGKLGKKTGQGFYTWP